jgi:hypothetical protein
MGFRPKIRDKINAALDLDPDAKQSWSYEDSNELWRDAPEDPDEAEEASPDQSAGPGASGDRS